MVLYKLRSQDPNINIINGIHNIKGKTSINVLVSNYNNKHIKFNKGEYIGCLEPDIEDNVADDTHKQGQTNTHSTNSITLQKRIAEQVQLETFHQPHHKLKPNIESKLDALLKKICFSIWQGRDNHRNNSSYRDDHSQGHL